MSVPVSPLVQPVAGVSATRETVIEVIYPSIAGGRLGKLVGTVMGVTAKISPTGLRLLANLILGGLMSPLAVTAYGLNKILGSCYVLTNRSIGVRPLIGTRLGRQVSLVEIAQIDVESHAGYEYHRAGDVVLKDISGNILLTVQAVTYPERLRQIILDAQNARIQADDAMAVISRREV